MQNPDVHKTHTFLDVSEGLKGDELKNGWKTAEKQG